MLINKIDLNTNKKPNYTKELVHREHTTAVNQSVSCHLMKDNLKILPLSRDMVSFQSSTNLFKLVEIGDPYKFYDSTAIKNAVYNQVSIMSNKIFSVQEYKSLTNLDKKYLDEVITKGYECTNCTSSISNHSITSSQRTVMEDAKFFIDISDKMHSVWNKEHPQGYHACFIGASPSIFERIMTYQGHNNVSNIPFTRTGASSNIDYKDYFSKFGLTKEIVKNTNKPIIFFDYFISPAGDKSQTLGKLINSLNSAGINELSEINRASNVNIHKNLIVDSFHRMLFTNKELFSTPERELMEDYFLFKKNIKSYATCPRMETAEHFNNADKIKEDYEWSLSAKLMNYALIKQIQDR